MLIVSITSVQAATTEKYVSSNNGTAFSFTLNDDESKGTIPTETAVIESTTTANTGDTASTQPQAYPKINLTPKSTNTGGINLSLIFFLLVLSGVCILLLIVKRNRPAT